jgi:NAD(P)-dependent dehydrogenase (short-subunit alcohol dehydrogenase family)
MEERMNLVVFGASRGVGRALTELALDADHQVPAVFATRLPSMDAQGSGRLIFLTTPE